MDCPLCQTSNPPAAVRCAKCDTPLPVSGGVATLTETPPDLHGATVVNEKTAPPETPDRTIVDKAPSTMEVPTGWSAPAPQPADAIAASLASLRPGSVLGNRYEILQQLGQGGMGAVYQARDRELDRMVAMKVIRPELATRPDILQRFKQELILARQVTHRNVIRIFDLGEAGGIKFITMEFIEGQDLKTLVTEKGKLSTDETVSIIEQVCLALEAAHAEGVVHRDLKPQNIMVDKQGKVSVMDFGIARSVELGGMTQTGALVGTPEYMSPEQVRGEKVDARSDLFTLGIIFYELLTGQPPYQADSAMATMFKRTKERATPAVQLDPSVPKPLSDIVAHCLEMDHNRRFQSAAEIRHALEAWRGPGMVFAAPHPPISSFPPVRWFLDLPTLRKWIVAGVTVLVLAAGTFAVFKLPIHVFSTSGPKIQPTSLAILPFRNASGDRAMDWLGPSLAEMLRTDVGQSSSLRTISTDRVHQILKDLRIPADAEFDPGTLKRLAEFSSAETLVWGQYAKVGDQIRIDATVQDLKRQRAMPLKVEAATEKDLLPAVQQLAQSIQQNLALSADVLKELRAKSLKPSSQSLPALRYYNEGLELARQGNHPEAAKRFEASTKADPDFALAYSKLGQTYSNLGYDEKAEQFSRKAVDLSDKLPPQERYLILANYAQVSNDNRKAIDSYENLAKVSPDDLDVHFRLGGLYETTSAFDKARDEYATVLTGDPKHVDALLAAGRVEIRRNNPQGSLDYLNRALSLAVELDNADAKATILNAIGAAYKQLNKPEEALRYYQESLAIKRNLGQKRGIAVTLAEIARVQAGLGKPGEAYKGYQEAVKLQREIGDKKGLGVTLINLGGLYKAREQYDEALKVYKESLQIQREVGNENNQGICLNNIGNVYLAKGQSSDAITYYERALELRNKAKIPSQIGETLHNLAEASLKAGEYERALDYHLRALELFRSSSEKRGAAIQSFSMGTIFEYQGRYGAALKSKEEALKTFRDLQERSLWMAEILGGYGHSLSQIGRYDEAQKSLDEALSLARQLQNKTKIAQVLNFQGDAFFYRGDLKSAANLFSQALAATSGTTEHEVILLSKFNSAKSAVKEGRRQAAVASLKTVIHEADALGLKYLSTEASLQLAEALMNTHQYPAARNELEVALKTSEKLGLQALLARSHYLLGRTLELTGSGAEASRHYAEARRLLETIHVESGTDAILKREDLSPISTLPAHKP
jgi:eukaryotic-like serine/threonine-protein kinase